MCYIINDLSVENFSAVEMIKSLSFHPLKKYIIRKILDLSMEKLLPTGNQMIDPRIRYVNEPGFGACVLPSTWTVKEPLFTKKKQQKNWL